MVFSDPRARSLVEAETLWVPHIGATAMKELQPLLFLKWKTNKQTNREQCPVSFLLSTVSLLPVPSINPTQLKVADIGAWGKPPVGVSSPAVGRGERQGMDLSTDRLRTRALP